MNMVEVKTAELIWPALDWAVAEAEGIQRFVMGNDWPGNSAVDDAADRDRVVICNLIGRLVVARGGWSDEWKPSASWAQGGPLIERFGCDLICIASGNCWEANCWDCDLPTPGLHLHEAETPLIAACRAIVAAKLGDAVSVPAELVQQQGEGVLKP